LGSKLKELRMKILIIDDHILFAEGMKYLLQSFGQEIITLYAENYEAAINAVDKFGHPDLILLDINLSGTSGFSLIKKFHALNIWSPILIISATDSQSAAEMSLEKGALGFVSKSSDKETLQLAIETVLSGNVYMPGFKVPETTFVEPNMATVTNRQHEILFLLSKGLLNKQIANELNISTNTVKAHLHEIFKQLNVNNRTAAVQTAHNYGLL